MPELMDGTSSFPSRPEMELNLADIRRANRAAGALRLQLGSDATRWRPVRAPDKRRRVPLSGGDLRGRRSRAVQARHARLRTRRSLRRDTQPGDLRRQAAVHRGQGELRLRACHRPPAVGAEDRSVLTAAGQAVGQHALAARRTGALHPAGRGPDPRWRSVHARTRRSTASTGWGAGSAFCAPAPTAARSWPSMSTRSLRRPGSPARCATWPASACRCSGAASCRR